jgi:hypothetical protein
MAADEWAADTPISMPLPAQYPILVDFGGFGFTEWGLQHNLNYAEWEELIQPDFAPVWHQVLPTRYFDGG